MENFTSSKPKLQQSERELSHKVTTPCQVIWETNSNRNPCRRPKPRVSALCGCGSPGSVPFFKGRFALLVNNMKYRLTKVCYMCEWGLKGNEIQSLYQRYKQEKGNGRASNKGNSRKRE